MDTRFIFGIRINDNNELFYRKDSNAVNDVPKYRLARHFYQTLGFGVRLGKQTRPLSRDGQNNYHKKHLSP